MKKHHIVLSLSMLFTAVAFQTPASARYADTETGYNQHRGPYIAGNLGTVVAGGRDADGNTALVITGLSANGTLGYQFNSNLGLEAGLTSMSDIFTESYIYDAAIKGILPLDNRFSLFGKIGAGGIHVDICDVFDTNHCNLAETDRAGLFLGAGASVALNHYLDITLEYNGILINSTKNNTAMIGGLGLGAVYHFG